EKNHRSSGVGNRWSSTEIYSSTAPTASKSNVMATMVSRVCTTEATLFWPKISPYISWFLYEKPPEKKYQKKPVKVMMPRPPTCMRINITVWPKRVNSVAMSMAESPVMHTALVAINRASTNPKEPEIMVLGNNSNNVPARISTKKLMTNRMVGLK